MKITDSTRALILKRLRDPNLPPISKQDIATALGYGKPWVTKLLNGTLKTLSDEQREKLEEILGFRFLVVSEKGPAVPEVLIDLAQKMQDNDALTRAIAALSDLAAQPVIFSPSWIETKDMTRLGQEIIRLAFAEQDKPGKVAREVLKLLR